MDHMKRPRGENMRRGKVYLVGAGPGHPELLTLKAAQLLKTCDVVVYDRLIQEEVLALAKPSAERIYMGKPLGRHDSRQDEIHEILVAKAREGKTVVRLKGGDPFVFGRGGEEAEYLAEHDVPFEVIPGVSSALAAPMSAGIAVTHRANASSVSIVTGHEAKEDASRLDWAALAKMDTLVFLMGVKNCGKIAARLIQHGRDPQTPAAMVQMAFWHDEHVVTGTLQTIEARVKEAGIAPPATLVIGETVRLHDKLKRSDRDLRRRPDETHRFDPAPVPDQLFRIAVGGMGSEVLGFGLECRLFDRLEDGREARSLAADFGWDAQAAGEILESLVSLGLLEKSGDGYRNLELASRYLRADSPQSLRPMLLEQARQCAVWEDLQTYATRGPGGHLPEDACHAEACESLARFAAPAVVDKLNLPESSSVLLLGWGGAAYKSAVSNRWPGIRFEHHNPFEAGGAGLKSGAVIPSPGPYGAVILSGLLASCGPGEVRRVLEEASGVLEAGGRLVLHDSFLPTGALPPPEVVLGTLARRTARGSCRGWSLERLRSTLEALGFDHPVTSAMPAGAVLVQALPAARAVPAAAGRTV